jgi:16S rRNA (cytosine967-C5)-methyltransferase
MISPARKLCFDLLRRIHAQKIHSDDGLNSPAVERLDLRDRHFTTEIVYGSLRWQGMLDYVLAAASSRPWQDVVPGARILLRMGLYQMWRMDRVPDHALVNDAVELAKIELGDGIDRFVNAVLRRLGRTRPWQEEAFLRKAPPWVRVSLPCWLWDRWAARYGEGQAHDFALSLNVPPRATVRLDENPDQRPDLEMEPSDIVPDAYFETTSGSGRKQGEPRRIHYQDEASQLVPHLLGPVRGWRIWDACAAPGGKYDILCRKCGAGGLAVASDLRGERISRLVRLLQKAKGLRAEVLVADACAPAPFRDCFDAVVADVPCSGLGTLRRNPEIKWHFQPERLASLQQTQERILDSVSKAVRAGGWLLYSTCSTEPEENEQVVESFLAGHKDFGLARPLHPPGIEAWTGQDMMVRTFPSTRLWDGFFAALMARQP